MLVAVPIGNPFIEFPASQINASTIRGPRAENVHRLAVPAPNSIKSAISGHICIFFDSFEPTTMTTVLPSSRWNRIQRFRNSSPIADDRCVQNMRRGRMVNLHRLRKQELEMICFQCTRRTHLVQFSSSNGSRFAFNQGGLFTQGLDIHEFSRS